MNEDQPSQLLDVPADLPLGAYPRAPRRRTEVALPAGSTLFLYTDGLVERRDRPIKEGISQLLAALEPASPEELCKRASEVVLSGPPASDDVAVLAIRRTN